MNKTNFHTLEDIDWLQLWKNARKKKSISSKNATDWDKKAASFAKRNKSSPYVSFFLSRLPQYDDLSILDIGCGPGTLSIPLAQKARYVTGIDYSEKMIEILRVQAEEQNLSNIRAVRCSWEEDWQQKKIAPHDIVIASRSMNIDDLQMAIRKLKSYAKQYVFITDRIDPSPFDPDAFKAVGRDFNSGPDYIYTLNMLYNENIHPCVEILEFDPKIRFDSLTEAMEGYGWMLKDLTSKETTNLKKYLQSQNISTNREEIIIHRKYPPKWALIWWKANDL